MVCGLAVVVLVVLDWFNGMGFSIVNGLTEVGSRPWNEAMFNGTRMRRQIKELDSRLVELENSEQDAVEQLTERTINLNDSMQRVVVLAGLNPKEILKINSGLPKGQGGPFIAAKPDGKPASKLKASLSDLERHLLQSEGLQDIMGRLPLAPPLTSYRITSPFGKRRRYEMQAFGAR